MGTVSEITASGLKANGLYTALVAVDGRYFTLRLSVVEMRCFAALCYATLMYDRSGWEFKEKLLGETTRKNVDKRSFMQRVEYSIARLERKLVEQTDMLWVQPIEKFRYRRLVRLRIPDDCIVEMMTISLEKSDDADLRSIARRHKIYRSRRNNVQKVRAQNDNRALKKAG